MWLDLAAKIVRVPDGPGQYEASTRAPRRRDRQVRSLLGSDSTGPHQIPTARARGPPVNVDAVGHHDHSVETRLQAAAVWRLTAANLDSRAAVAPMADSSQENGGVCNVLSIGVLESRSHSYRHLMQAVIVNHVESGGASCCQFRHQLDVSVVIRFEYRPRRRERPCRGGAATQCTDIQPGTFRCGVRTRRREECDMVAVLAQGAGEVPDVRLESSGERLADREPVGGDQCDANLVLTTGLAHTAQHAHSTVLFALHAAAPRSPVAMLCRAESVVDRPHRPVKGFGLEGRFGVVEDLALSLLA